MATQIYSVTPGSYQKCDTFGTGVNKYSGNTSYGPIKVGASGAITEDYWGDIDGFWYQSGHPESGESGQAKWAGSNGRDHWAIFKLGDGSGRYLGGHVTGLKFRENNNSTAGHGLYIFRYGIQLVGKNSTTIEMYDLSGKLSRPSNFGKTHSKTFNATLQDKLSSGNWLIDKLLVEVSTQGGSGSRTTYTTITDLQFMTRGSTISGGPWKLILPAKRPRKDRHETNRIG